VVALSATYAASLPKKTELSAVFVTLEPKTKVSFVEIVLLLPTE
jgi:hypothetical protein